MTFYLFQQSLFARLRDDKCSETFFRTFYQYMFEAQTEIKNTIVVTTAELLSEKKLDEPKHPPLLRNRGMVLTY